jgi:hypothetical protein
MTKSPKAFRLSDQALESLRFLVSETGSNETAIVEMALAFLKKSLQGQEVERVPETVADLVSDLPEAKVIPHKKKRRRH